LREPRLIAGVGDKRDFAGPCIVDRRRASDLDRRIAFKLAAEASRQFTE